MRKKKILITGSNGFVGSYLYKSFQSDFQVSRLDREKLFNGDSKNLVKAIKNFDVIIHLAGKTRGESLEIFNVNFLGTIRLLDAISSISGKKPLLIFPSTIGVYKPSLNLNEESVCDPKSFYALSKFLAEEAIHYYAEKCDFPALVFRISNIYGPGMPPFSHSVIATFIELIKSKKSLSINGNGLQKRDFIYISDVAWAFKKAIGVNIKPGSVVTANLGSSFACSLKNLVKIISGIENIKVTCKYDLKVKDYSWVFGDYIKLNKILKWRPEVGLKEGIRKVYEKA